MATSNYCTRCGEPFQKQLVPNCDCECVTHMDKLAAAEKELKQCEEDRGHHWKRAHKLKKKLEAAEKVIDVAEEAQKMLGNLDSVEWEHAVWKARNMLVTALLEYDKLKRR